MFSARAEEFAKYIIDNKCTIRECAKVFDYSKSTIHNDVSNKLRLIDQSLYEKTKQVLENNFAQKHFDRILFFAVFVGQRHIFCKIFYG